MAIHTFGEYLDFHPHLHELVADGLFDREGKFHVMRAGPFEARARSVSCRRKSGVASIIHRFPLRGSSKRPACGAPPS